MSDTRSVTYRHGPFAGQTGTLSRIEAEIAIDTGYAVEVPAEVPAPPAAATEDRPAPPQRRSGRKPRVETEG